MDTKSSFILLFFEMFLEVSASYSTSGLYRGVWYQPVEHHALVGQTFMTISGISAVRCSVRCLSHDGCFSFNYDHINQVCQLNSVTGDQICDFVQGMLSFSYYDATAKSINCQNNSDSRNRKRTALKICSNSEKLGLEDGSIPDESLTASSIRTEGAFVSTPAGGRLNKVPPYPNIVGAWHPRVADTNQWIQVNLGSPTYVTGVLTQGRNGGNPQWVTKYKVQFQPPSPACLVDVKDQLAQTQIFNGNTDRNSIVERRFFKPVLAVKIRVVPVQWYGYITLRFELLGCK